MRQFEVKTHNFETRIIRGSFSFGAFNAAREYAREFLPGFEVIPCGARLDLLRWRFEAVNHETQTGALLWVFEK